MLAGGEGRKQSTSGAEGLGNDSTDVAIACYVSQRLPRSTVGISRIIHSRFGQSKTDQLGEGMGIIRR